MFWEYEVVISLKKMKGRKKEIWYFFLWSSRKNSPTVGPWGFEKGHNTLATCYERVTHLKRPQCWERLNAGGEGDDRGWDCWMASPTQRTWVWVDSGSWWWTGRPGLLQSVGSQRVGHNWVTELNWTELTMVGAERLRPPAGCCGSWFVKAWYLPSKHALESQMSQHGWISMSQGSAHECFTRPPPSLAFTLGTGAIDCPQNCGQKSSIRSVCAGSLFQTRRLPAPHLGRQMSHVAFMWCFYCRTWALGKGSPIPKF